ncbi:MAG: sugar ABC transporter permease [Spirochaetaceae bacterium]|nr:MAG: sugar ABC transporter permease [Spirochaetaceae bacterium]
MSKRQRIGLHYATKIKLTGFLFVLPVLVYFGVLSFFPILSAFFYSFFEYNIFSEGVFVGFRNYIAIFSSPQFINSLKATLIYTLGYCVIVFIVAFGLALLLKRSFPLRDAYQFIFFMPLVISLIVISITWYAMFIPSGLVNNILGTKKIDWLTSTKLAIWVVILLSVWKWSGFYMIVFLSGLNAIPEQYYDAAKIDGAGNFTSFRLITLPLLKPTITFVLVISMIGSVKVIEPMYIITKGGPVDSTRVLALRIYEEAFKNFNMGRASAMSVVLFMIILILTVLQFRLIDIKE